MLTRISRRPRITAAVVLLLCAPVVLAQGTSFTYQGKLSVGGNPANGPYDMQFKLFDTQAVGSGVQQGATVTTPTVQVGDGIFTVQLDFGAVVFTGANRFLEIAVRAAGSPDPYTPLGPRQPITTTPYAIRSLLSTAADGLSVACVNCVTTNQISSVSGSVVNGEIPVTSVPAGSANYVQNTTTEQAGANFNISGGGTAGGTLRASTIRARTITGAYGLIHTDDNGANAITVGTYVGGSASGATGGWLGTLTPHKMHFFTGGGQPSLTIDTTGNVGIGTTATNMGKLNVVNSALTEVAVFANGGSNVGLYGISSGFAVRGESSGAGGYGVYGSVAGNTGYAVYGESLSGNTFAVYADGYLGITRLGVGGDVPLCHHSLDKKLATCSSSLRYKDDVQLFNAGLELIRRLRPVTYKWKAGGKADLGLIAEEVAEVEPLLTTHNDIGEIEGVKYGQLNVVLINAVKQQQAQIEELQEQLRLQQTVIDGLQELVCGKKQQAEICRGSATK